MREEPVSAKRQALIDAKNNSPLSVGERISVFEKAVSSFVRNEKNTVTCTIHELKGKNILVFVGTERERTKNTEIKKITKEDIASRELYYIGANPFDETFDHIRPVAFTLDSILFHLDVLGVKRADGKPYQVQGIDVMEANWNPYIFDKDGKKQYYQRPLVWTLEDKQLLVESIYQNIDCGKILVRKRSFKELEELAAKGEKEFAFQDVVDGKQRLNAVGSFIKGEFADAHGNYYGDLSYSSQRKFTNHQLFSYAEMPEETKDADVIRQFLKLNFAGVPQSKEHIEFVKSLNA